MLKVQKDLSLVIPNFCSPSPHHRNHYPASTVHPLKVSAATSTGAAARPFVVSWSFGSNTNTMLAEKLQAHPLVFWDWAMVL